MANKKKKRDYKYDPVRRAYDGGKGLMLEIAGLWQYGNMLKSSKIKRQGVENFMQFGEDTILMVIENKRKKKTNKKPTHFLCAVKRNTQEELAMYKKQGKLLRYENMESLNIDKLFDMAEFLIKDKGSK